MPGQSVAAFIEAVSRLGLLEKSQQDELARVLVVQFPDVQALAKELWQRGWLTRYQIEQILKGEGEELVLGQYVLLEPLGEGGMGQVFKAKQVRLNRLVAVKIIHKERLSNSDATRRFYREIQAASQLSHPNIVLAYDADQVGDKNFFVMEYLEGVDLMKLVKQAGPLPVAQACDFIRQAALGLQHAYECGMVHRDIKPSNLIVTYARTKTGVPDSKRNLAGDAGPASPPTPLPAGQRIPIVKILDLGLARFKSSTETEASATLTKEGYLLGTLDYIAPEQASDPHQVDIRADLYSLGCTLYFLLTGQAPFSGGSPMEKLFRHQMEKPRAIEQIRPDVPPGLVVVLARMMAKRPQERYQTPAQLATVLTAVLNSVSSTAGVHGSGSHAVQVLPGEPTIALPGMGGPPPPTTTAEETLESATSWSKIIAAHAPTSASPKRKKNRGNANQPLYWMIATGVGLTVATVVLLVFVLTRPDKPAQTADNTPPPVTKSSKKSSGKTSRSTETEGRAPITTVKVEAGKPWQDTGIEIKTGEQIAIEAVGQWQRGELSCSANGLPAEPRDHTELLEAPFMSLVGRVGDDPTPIFLGSGRNLTARQDGRLFVQANALHLQGNSGSLELRIRGGTRYEIPAVPHKPTQAEAAEGALKALETKGKLAELRDDLREFRLQFPGTPQAERAAVILRGFPSLLDQLRPEQIPTQERFSWQPKELVAVFGEHRQRHWGTVRCVAFSPDGKLVASGGDDGLICTWNVTTGKQEAVLKGHADSVYGVVFAPDGKTLISVNGVVSSNGTVESASEIRFSDVGTQKGLRFVPGFSSVLLSPDCKTFATRSSDGTVKLWDLATTTERSTLKGHSLRVNAVALSPDGKFAATASDDKTVRLWDAATGKERFSCPGHNQIVRTVVFAPDGKSVASGGDDARIRLWEVATGQEEASFGGHAAGINSIAFSTDGKLLVSASSDQTVKLWDTVTRQARLTLRGHYGVVNSVALSSDKKSVASAGVDHAVRLWDVAPDAENANLTKHTDRVWAVACSPDGRTAASAGGDSVIRIWDTATREEKAVLRGHDSAVFCLTFLTNGLLASGDGDGAVKLWEPARNKQAVATIPAHNGPVFALACTADGRMLATGGRDATVKLWDVAARLERPLPKIHKGPVRAVAFTHDGRTLASASEDATVRLWDVAKGKEIERDFKSGTASSPFHAVALSADDRLLAAGGEDGTVRQWELTTGAEQPALKAAIDWINALTYAPDGRTLVSASRDGGVKLWDLSSGLERITLSGHAGSVRAAVYTPDSKGIITGGDDKTVKFWRATLGQELQPLAGQSGEARCFAFAPDNSQLAAGFDDGSIAFWDLVKRRLLNIRQAHGQEVLALACSPAGKHLVSAARDGNAKLWSLGTSKEPTLLPHAAVVASAGFSPDGQVVGTGGNDGIVKLWSTESGALLDSLPPETQFSTVGFYPPANSIIWIPQIEPTLKLRTLADIFGPTPRGLSDGRTTLAVPSDQKSYSLWDVGAQKERVTLENVGGEISAAAFSPDGSLLATGTNNQVLKLWQTATGKELALLKGHLGPIHFVAFTADGKKLVSGGDNGRLFIFWDTETGRKLSECRLPGPAHGVTLAPDGRHLGLANANGTVYILRLSTPVSAAAGK